MYFIHIELNLKYTSGESVRIGPYSFDDWDFRKTWKGRFTMALTRLYKSGFPYKIEADFLDGELLDEEEIMDAPDPKEIVDNLQVLWERGVIVPVTGT